MKPTFSIVSKPSTPEYREGWERIFGDNTSAEATYPEWNPQIGLTAKPITLERMKELQQEILMKNRRGK